MMLVSKIYMHSRNIQLLELAPSNLYSKGRCYIIHLNKFDNVVADSGA